MSESGEHRPAAADMIALWDWRRRVAELYAIVRSIGDREHAWHVWRQGRDNLFRAHSQSPLGEAARRAFTGLTYFNYDPGLCLGVTLEPVADGEPIAGMAGLDVKRQPFAMTKGLAEAAGAELTLYGIGGYGGGIFLPFLDASSGQATFGGGRYLLDTVKGADVGLEAAGTVFIDFNFAYNPSCAYDRQWHCPLAPAENRLPVAIQAGEKAPGFRAR